MSYDVSATVSEQQVKLDGTRPINMFVLNASLSGWNPLYYADNNQDVFGFEMNASGNLVATDNIVYTGLPIQYDTIKNQTTGEISEVSISIPNTDRVIDGHIQDNNYLRGRDVYILTCFADHLPSGSTATHIGTSPDRFATIKEKMYVDAVTTNQDVATFSCKPKFVIKNIVLPGRTFSRECSWALKGRYLETECDPSSNISATTFPTCDGTLENCRARNNVARFGGFVSIPSRGITIIT